MDGTSATEVRTSHPQPARGLSDDQPTWLATQGCLTGTLQQGRKRLGCRIGGDRFVGLWLWFSTICKCCVLKQLAYCLLGDTTCHGLVQLEETFFILVCPDRLLRL